MMPQEKFRERLDALSAEMARAVVGYRAVVADLLMGVFAGGNILQEAAPGLGKTLLGKTLAAALSMRHARLPFTPDLMPADIIGTNIVVEDQRGRREMVFQRGPVFTNLLLADEINRAPPKTQSALLEAMQEHHVTVAGKTHVLDEPFLVVATQNPEDREGTYRLPEAQLDRFLFRLRLTELSDQEWLDVARRRTGTAASEVHPVLSREEVVEMQAAVRRIDVDRRACAYAARLVRATHPKHNGHVPSVRKYVRLGASPRGIQALILGAKMRALCAGRQQIAAEDVRSVAAAALGHRLLLNFEGLADGVQAETIVQEVIDRVPVEMEP
jgi:MoxR-like ATPase